MKNVITVKRRGTPRGTGVNYLAASGGLKQTFHTMATDEAAFIEVANKFSKVLPGYEGMEFAAGILEEDVRVFVPLKKADKVVELEVVEDSEG